MPNNLPEITVIARPGAIKNYKVLLDGEDLSHLIERCEILMDVKDSVPTVRLTIPVKNIVFDYPQD